MKPILFFLFTCSTSIAYTQAPRVNPAIQWQKSLGGSNPDGAYSIRNTRDGGYIVAGYSNSNDGDVNGHHGGYMETDYWIVKLDSAGAIQWQKSLGGSYIDMAYGIDPTKDGGYIVAGYSFSNDGDVSGNHGGYDYWIVKLDSTGAIQWQKSLGGTDWDEAYSIQPAKDGGYIVIGYSNSNDGDVSGHHGTSIFKDYWIAKLDSIGAIQWQKSLGGSSDDIAYSIALTKDSGYIVAGFSASNDGDISSHHGTTYTGDCWIVKLNSTGAIQWQKSLGGSDYDGAFSIDLVKDGGYIVAGYSSSNDGDVSGNHGVSDYWIIKLDNAGTILWQKSLGGSYNDIAYSIQQTKDGDFVVAGYSYSNDGDVRGNHGGFDYWIAKLSNTGAIQKSVCLGGIFDEIPLYIRSTFDNSYIIAGFSYSNNGDVRGHHGSTSYRDYWIVKLKPQNSLLTTQNDVSIVSSNSVIEGISKTINIHPNPSQTGTFTLNFKEPQNNIIITVTDNAGKKVYADKLSSAQQLIIFLNNRPKGIYYLHVSYDGGSATAKLVVE